MKTQPLASPLAVCAALTLLVTGAVQATVIYQDNFDGASGSLLQGRSPNLVNTTGNTYTTLAPTSQLQVNGSGWLGTTGTGGVAWLALPTISSGDVITLTVSMRPASTTSNFIAVGFSDGTSDLITKGTAWALLRGSGNANQGQVLVRSGNGTSGVLYNPGTQEPDWGGASPSTMTLIYNTGTGNLQARLGATTLFNGIIDYNGVTDTPAPLSALTHVSIQWLSENSLSSGTPGYVDSLQVDVVPEPASVALLLAGGVAAGVLRWRKNRRANALSLLNNPGE